MRWLILLLLISCGDSTGYNSNEFQREIAGAQNSDVTFSTFDTRVSNDLRLSGSLCQGGEVADSQGETFVCEAGQWLVVVDNLNTCTPEGCTTVVVQPIIANLDVEFSDQISVFFAIGTEMTITLEQQRILNSVLIRSRGNEKPVVVFR